MESQIVIFEANNNEGYFSKNEKFYPIKTKKYIENKFLETRKNMGKHFGFNYLKMFEVRQKMQDNDDYPDNKYVVLDDTHMQKEDFLDEEVHADILIISNKYPGIAVGHRQADCPVLILEDRKKGITAICHTNTIHINRELPKYLVKTMIDDFNSKASNLYLYIGSCVKKENYIYDRYPIWATNEKVWHDAIVKEEDGYHIDMEKAILKQVKIFDLKEIKVSPIDTAGDNQYASHTMLVKGHKDKAGQNFVGFYYKKNED
ncbi:MAG: laccase domain-containing protein [Bacilli bacterium]|nr:laccase domain-containing protein [Bacilli bacterium]MBQ6538692.1 laccase domain-containing protein [Bacilli bacterium]